MWVSSDVLPIAMTSLSVVPVTEFKLLLVPLKCHNNNFFDAGGLDFFSVIDFRLD